MIKGSVTGDLSLLELEEAKERKENFVLKTPSQIIMLITAWLIKTKEPSSSNNMKHNLKEGLIA